MNQTMRQARKQILALVALLVLAGTVASAHEGNEHVRGVVTKIDVQSNWITVRTAPDQVRTLSLTDKTAFKLGSKSAQLSDLKVGDRVVIDVPQKTAKALLIQIGSAPAAAASK